MASSVARDRHFYSLPKHAETIRSHHIKDKNSILNYIKENLIGKNKQFSGPYGLREALYLDYTASGKSLKFIEDYIRDAVLPEYGNTHTTTSVTSLQTTLFRHEARDIVRNAVHASEHDAVIFVGSGSTGAVHKLIHGLSLDQAPVVIVGPFEHHSNLLPWKEVGAKVIRVKLTPDSQVDIGHLKALLQKWENCGRQLIGCFSAASNITGILTDIDAVTVMLHKHGALAFWDYATAAPYVKIDMNPVSASVDQPYMYKDAVFLSCHKFVGGVQTPGVLIAKKKVFKNTIPGGCGGGSVFFVRRDSHRYLQEPELKEEGGTPAIVEAIRAGLVFQLKQAITSEVIMEREEYMVRRAREVWKDHPSLILLGNRDVPRLPIFSFLVYHGESGRFLHYNYVSSLLNDLFGIQARGGCACAGPYAMDLLGMEETISRRFEELLAEDSRLDRTHLRRYREYSQREIIRPGFTRINLPFFLSEEELEFVLEAVKIVAEEGWKLLPEYMFNPETGEWRQKNFQVFKDRKWLGHISYSSGEMSYKVPPPIVKGPLPTDYKDCLQKAKDLFAQASKKKHQVADNTIIFDDDSKPLRWFALPSEAESCLRGNQSKNTDQLPFCPPSLRERIGLPVFVENQHEVDDSDYITDITKDRHWKGAKGFTEQVNGEKSDVGIDDSGKLFSEGMQNCLDKGFVDNESVVCTKLVNGDSRNNNNGKSCDKEMLEEVGTDSKNKERVKEESTETAVKIAVGSNTEVMKERITQSENKIVEGIADSIKGETTQSDRLRTEKTEVDSEKVCDSVPARKLAETVEKESEKNTNIEKDSNKSQVNESKGSEKTGSQTCSMRKCPDNKACCPSTGAVEGRKRQAEGDITEGQKKRAKDEKQINGACDTIEGKTKKKKENKWFSPPKTIFAPFLKAMEEFSMVQDGDKVLICLSGGKDSLSLLHTMRQYQFYCKKKNIKFDLGAVTVDPETEAYDPSPLKPYLASLGVPYFYESQCILEQASNLPYECASICSFCSRMKRGRIYACARREGYNVLALGQHLDDQCESFLMSVFHNGLLRTMKAHYTVQEGDLRVIRPLVYTREKDLRMFAEKNHLPVIAENCPGCFEAPKERHRVKQLLAAQEIMFPRIFPSMMSAIKPIMAINKTQTKLADLLNQGNTDDQDDMDI